MERSWIGQKDSFRVMHVRKATEIFLPKLLKQTQEIEVGNRRSGRAVGVSCPGEGIRTVNGGKYDGFY